MTPGQLIQITEMAVNGDSVLKIRSKLKLSYVQIYNYLKQKKLPITLEKPDKGYNHRMLKKANNQLNEKGFFDEMAYENWII